MSKYSFCRDCVATTCDYCEKRQIRADAIDECIKTIIDYCGGLPNGMYVNALKQLKEQKNEMP